MVLTVGTTDVSVQALPPIRFGGRVEAAFRGGLCLLAEAAVDHQRVHRRIQSLLPRSQGHPVSVKRRPLAEPGPAGFPCGPTLAGRRR